MRHLDYQRTIIAYHGCDEALADRVLRTGETLKVSENDYDWLGTGIYFWEFGPDRAMAWAEELHRRYPTLPMPNSPLESQVIRDQFQALFNLINNIATITAAQVDGVTTVNPGDPANVSVSVSGGTLHLSFSIPRGNDGAQGEQGMQGQTGPDGPVGPPFANAVVDGVTTLNAGEPASVGLIFDGTTCASPSASRAAAMVPRGRPARTVR